MTQARCYCNDVENYGGTGHFPHHPSYPYWRTQRGKTVRITRGAFKGETGRIGMFDAFSADVRIPDKTTVNIHYDDLEVATKTSCTPGRWCRHGFYVSRSRYPNCRKPVKPTEEPHTCLGYGPCGVPGCRHYGGRHPCCDCPSVPEPLKPTKEDIGKKFLVVRGILKGEEGTLKVVASGTNRVLLGFQEAPQHISGWIPFEDLEPVE